MTAITVPLQLNAMANRATGKGYETEQNYVGMKVHFFSIENIHVMRSALNKLVEGERFIQQQPLTTMLREVCLEETDSLK